MAEVTKQATVEVYASGLTSRQVDAAVNWWKQAIESPRYDNGDDSPTGGMVTMLAMMAEKPKSSDSVEAFGAALAEILKADERVAQQGLHVDYNPEGALYDAAQKAGMKLARDVGFPWKTNMWFTDDGGVKVSAGYGASQKYILEPIQE